MSQTGRIKLGYYFFKGYSGKHWTICIESYDVDDDKYFTFNPYNREHDNGYIASHHMARCQREGRLTSLGSLGEALFQ